MIIALNFQFKQLERRTLKKSGLFFSGFFFPIALNWKFTAMIILHFHLQPQFKYELFHIYFTSKNNSLFILHVDYE